MPNVRVFRGLDQARGGFAPSGVTIGNFDGCHRGHQELFSRLVERSRAASLKPSVMTFDPHPARVLAPARAPRLLSTVEERLPWMAACGVEQVLVVPFSREFAALTPEEFIRQALVVSAGARLVLVGENFHFGHKQAGNVAVLRELGSKLGFETEVVTGVHARRVWVSSTGIRRQIECGNVYLARRLLGRPYSLSGPVVPGRGVGQRQTVPTLNLATQAEVLPARGVYVTSTRDLNSPRQWPSVTNVGFRPTFEGDALSIESFVLEGYSEPPPQRLRIDFLHRLRDERKFPDPAALKAQILRDASRAAAYWRRLRRWTSSDSTGTG